MQRTTFRLSGILQWLTLFTSTGTLICCALPIAFVALGFGASVAAVTTALPFLVVFSVHKIWVFVISGLMLIVMSWLAYRPQKACPADAELRVLCEKTRRWNFRIFCVSVIIWSIGFFAAFIALPLRVALDG